jgi:hypothetical protein
MKKLCKFVGLLGALALAATIVSAESATDSLRVNVPFSFVIAGKLFPAGQYTVQETDAGLILVQGEGKSAAALTIPGNPMKAGAVPALHFTASNGHEHLVSVDNESSSRALPMRAYETRVLTLSH